MSRIGLLGSSFDPPHSGHLAMVRTALAWGLDAIWLIPACIPPHKQGQTHATPHQRLAMAELAVLHEPQVLINPCEIVRGGVSYTIETLEELAQAHPQHEWFLLLGEDSWHAIGTWKEAQRFPELAHFLIFDRHSQPVANDHPFAGLPAVVHFPAFSHPASSSVIRQQIAQDAPGWGSMVPRLVEDFIRKYGLYGARALSARGGEGGFE